MATSDELLKQMYDSNLASQKAALQSDYDAAVADLNAQKAANQQQAQNTQTHTDTGNGIGFFHKNALLILPGESSPQAYRYWKSGSDRRADR